MSAAAQIRPSNPWDFDDHGLSEIMAEIAHRADEAETRGLGPDIALLLDAGLLRACLSSAKGGADIGLTAGSAEQTFTILRWLGRANLSVGRLFEGHVNALKLVHLYGHPDLQERIGKEVEDGALLGVWGADGKQALRFQRTDHNFRLEGQKIFASGLGYVRFAIVSLKEREIEDASTRLAILEVSDTERQDAAAWQASGMRATQSGTFEFTGLEFCEQQLLGKASDYEREPYFDGGVWRYCAVHLGGAESLLHHCCAMLSKNGRIDDPLQLTRMSRGMALCRAMASLLRETAVRVEAARPENAADVDKAVAAALLARQFTEESCTEIVALVEKSLGTAAYMPSAVERIRRDLSLFVRQAAPDSKLLKAGRLILSQAADLPW